jgi:hypothetical protein
MNKILNTFLMLVVALLAAVLVAAALTSSPAHGQSDARPVLPDGTATNSIAIWCPQQITGPTGVATWQAVACGVYPGAFAGSSSLTTITGTVSAVIPAGAKNLLAYQVSGATTDYACAVWASSAPTFTLTGTGLAASCGVPGSFVLNGQSKYGPANPPASGQALYAQIFSGGTVADSFTVSAEW